MCEIFSTIGAMLLGSAGAMGIGGGAAGTAATTAIGAAAAASTVAGLAGAGIGIANGIRSAHEGSARASAAQNALLNKNNKFMHERTATQLMDNAAPKRTITSLRIPLDKTSNSGLNTQSSQTMSGTGLNIPL